MSEPAPPPPPPQAPGSPRSPRPNTNDGDLPLPATTPGYGPGVFVGQPAPPAPRQSVSSLLMLTMFFFFMSGNGPAYQPVVGPDGEFRPHLTELQLLRTQVGEYTAFLNGTGNWTEPPTPSLLPSAITPPAYDHTALAAAHAPFFTNITGWYRHAAAHTVDLGVPRPEAAGFFGSVALPSLNTTSAFNSTLATESRGRFNWSDAVKWDLHVSKERRVTFRGGNGTALPEDGHGAHGGSRPDPRAPDDWVWVKGTSTIETSIGSAVNYGFFGLHFVPNGTYTLYAMPEGLHIDVRNIPPLLPAHHNITSSIVLAELEKELKAQEDSFVLTDVKDEPEDMATRCPLVIQVSLPPLPAGVHPADVAAYESELSSPTGILTSLVRPPRYWEGKGLGGVAVSTECALAIGFDNGRGVPIDDFWRRSVNYAAYATVTQLVILVLLVRQMEATRTPSTLAKVSLWSIVIILLSDAWMFSAHAAIGLVSDNKASLPMLVPGFFGFCTVFVFGVRYAVLLNRIQAPERTYTPPVAAPAATAASAGAGATEATSPTDTTTDTPEPRRPFSEVVTDIVRENPAIQWFGGVLFTIFMFNILLMPSLVPFVLFATNSMWVPQIYRNATRGSSQSLSHTFVVGVGFGLLAIPLYPLACPNNIWFVDNADWVWGMVVWQIVQILILFAQDRFGPAFLPARLGVQELLRMGWTNPQTC
ncbi:DSC E3 ubiquitin ligase complex subunit 1 [Vanrija pseudolonga]|uniref:RING-type E3 ubiquitin transferase n=1 Tax=Vanrija pseudolonga TaxID=143232 RepID=A0AAF1BH54_9TREE|nr:DSC E3 ubiquitin ligase complex subunit 1 [Vanrija pseudolonga]